MTVKNPETATVIVSSAASSKYTGATKKINFTVSPKKVISVRAVCVKTRTAKISWKRDSSVTGYEIIIAKDKNFKKSKVTFNVTSSKTVSKTISKLNKGTTYYVRVRSYKTVSKSKIYGAYSDIKPVKIR